MRKQPVWHLTLRHSPPSDLRSPGLVAARTPRCLDFRGLSLSTRSRKRMILSHSHCAHGRSALSDCVPSAPTPSVSPLSATAGVLRDGKALKENPTLLYLLVQDPTASYPSPGDIQRPPTFRAAWGGESPRAPPPGLSFWKILEQPSKGWVWGMSGFPGFGVLVCVQALGGGCSIRRACMTFPFHP